MCVENQSLLILQSLLSINAKSILDEMHGHHIARWSETDLESEYIIFICIQL